jgi:hypothetical protein
MGEAIALALKFGVAAMPAIVAEYGFVTAIVAFVVFMPPGHFTIGLVLALIGVFIPRLPDEATTHQLRVGSTKANLQLKGNSRTVMFGLGALIMILSVIEGLTRSSAL